MSVISSPSGPSIWRQSLFPAALSNSASQPSSPASSAVNGDADAQSPLQPKLPDPRSELQKSLSQGLQDYMQKLKVDLNRPVKRQSSEADAMQKTVLKQRVEGLRRMMMMAHDKASLRALASELARLAKELKGLVESMSQNSADSQMTVSVGGDQAAGDAALQGSGADGVQSSDGAASSFVGEAASSDEGGGASSGADAASAQQASNGQSAADRTASDANAKEQGGGAQPAGNSQAQAADPRAAQQSAQSGGKGNPVAGDSDILEMQMTLKMVKEFIKQQMQQMKDKRETQDDLQSAEKALGDVDKILKGGPEAEAAMGEQMSVNISDVASNINVTA
ncbi:hypothetical protein ACFFU8_06315 [Chromobacterium piscinae]|uniref:hypothetical protein n=1 Tax=Chromobacterium piscinae TaxID=686831 RepID=UPI001E4B05D1|nr:hypothetical protein [Chromobacterium piscinae]MCD5326292.1 hypothetical protein [Chromobacterium piscinae]